MSALRTFALAAVAAAALAGSAQAQSGTSGNQPVPGKIGRGHGRGEKMGGFRDLNLTDAQKNQIKAIHAKYQAQIKTSREQAKPYLDAARAARQKGDTAGFRTNMEKARQVSSAVRQQEMNEVRAVFTPEQRAKADSLMAQRKQFAGGRGGMRPGFRGQRGPRGAPFAELNLTDAQKTQMKAIRAKYQGQAQSSRQAEMNEIRAVLTPEQRTKLDAQMKQRPGFRGNRKLKG